MEETSKVNLNKVIYFLIFIAIIILLQIFASHNFKSKEIEITMYLQQYEELDFVFKFLSFLGSKQTKLYLIPVIMNVFNIYQSFLFTLLIGTTFFTSSFFKILLLDDRPFWRSPFVKMGNCESGYGFPSEHTYASIPVFLLLTQMVWQRMKLTNENKDFMFKIISAGLVFLIVFLIGLSRVYFGLHYTYHVCISLLLGLSTFMLFFYVLDIDIENNVYFTRIFRNANFHRLLLFIYLGIYFAYLLIILVLNNSDIGDMTYVIAMRCGKLNGAVVRPLNKSLLGSATYFLIASSLLGIWFNYKCFRQDTNLCQYLSEDQFQVHDQENQEESKNMFFIALITKICAGIVILFLARNFIYISGIDFKAQGVFIQFFVEKLIPTILEGFLVFGFTSKINESVDRLFSQNANLNQH